jgi:hypothetical protein
MVYTFELVRHPNVRYRDAVAALSKCELVYMLRALHVEAEVETLHLGNSLFLRFECSPLSDADLSFLSGHSSLALMAEQVSGLLLRPLSPDSSSYLPEDLPEVLKYKGKTGVPFTRMMINTAAAMSSFSLPPGKMVFFDPLSGRGTGCFCALCAGMNAVGLDRSDRDLSEASAYFSRYLQYHRLKHRVIKRAETSGKISIPVTSFEFSDTAVHFQSGDRRFLSLACADTALSPALFRRNQAHVLAADLPYGIQHAPVAGRKPENMSAFLKRSLPAWKTALASGGAMAISFNTLTLPTQTVLDAVAGAGLTPVTDQWTCSLTHEVEQAVVRNVVFALKS